MANKDFSASQLSKKSGISTSTIYSILNPDNLPWRHYIQVNTVNKLADGLGIPSEALLSNEYWTEEKRMAQQKIERQQNVIEEQNKLMNDQKTTIAIQNIRIEVLERRLQEKKTPEELVQNAIGTIKGTAKKGLKKVRGWKSHE